jgi:hypothetical protein
VEAVKDSNEQLLTVVSVVIIEEFGDKEGAETDSTVEFELAERVVDEVVIEELLVLLFVLELLLMVVVFCVEDVEIEDAAVLA